MISLVSAVQAGFPMDDIDERRALRQVSVASSVGSLSDRMALSALRVKAGLAERLDSSVADQAIGLLEALQSTTTEPVHVTSSPRDSGALGYLAHSMPEVPAAERADNPTSRQATGPRVQKLVDAVTAGLQGTATQKQLDLIVRFFTHVAEATLRAASDPVSHGHSEAPWTITIRPS